MQITFTARHFRADPEIREHALDAVEKLNRFYDGIVRADIILSYERAKKSIKTSEVNLHVYGVVLSAKEKSDNFMKSTDAVVEKLSIRLRKYKSKLRGKDRQKVRSLQEKV